MLHQRSRLRIVDHNEVCVEIQGLGILSVHLEISLIHLGRDNLLLPLQGMVKAFGDR